MTRIFKLLFLGISFLSYSQDFKDNFPTEIKTEISEDHIPVDCTKFFAKIPNDYKFNKDLLRYQKKENLYVQFIESNASSFHKFKPNLNREAIESQGHMIDVVKDVKLNDLNAVFFDGPSETPYERKTVLAFGDSEFVAFAIGVYPENDNEGRNEVLEIFKSIVYLKSLVLNPFKFAMFEFDQSITGFKFAKIMSDFYIFNKDGNPEPKSDFSNFIKIVAIPPVSKTPSENSKEMLMRIASSPDETMISPEIITTKIGNYPASVLESEFEIDNRKGQLYMVILEGSESRVIFIGYSFNRKPELLKKYKETVKTIKIK